MTTKKKEVEKREKERKSTGRKEKKKANITQHNKRSNQEKWSWIYILDDKLKETKTWQRSHTTKTVSASCISSDTRLKQAHTHSVRRKSEKEHQTQQPKKKKKTKAKKKNDEHYSKNAAPAPLSPKID